MRDLLAPVLRRVSAPGGDGLVLRCDPHDPRTWELVRRRRGTTARIATLTVEAADATWRQAFASRRRGETVVIALARPFLVRETTVPAAAAGSLDRVLRYEMDRLTPFAAADVLFAYRPGVRDPLGSVLRVQVAVVPRTWVADLLARLAVLSIRPAMLEAPQAGAEEPLTIPLDDADPTYRARARMAWRLGFGVCGVLAAATLAIPIVRQSLALAAVEDRIAALRPRMDQVDALRRRIAAGSAGAGQIAAAREKAAEPLRILGLLTGLLPDDTFLTSISLRQGQMTMEGHSAAATKLIASMAAEPRFRNPAFAAPVVRADNGKDVFTIQAGFGP